MLSPEEEKAPKHIHTAKQFAGALGFELNPEFPNSNTDQEFTRTVPGGDIIIRIYKDHQGRRYGATRIEFGAQLYNRNWQEDFKPEAFQDIVTEAGLERINGNTFTNEVMTGHGYDKLYPLFKNALSTTEGPLYRAYQEQLEILQNNFDQGKEIIENKILPRLKEMLKISLPEEDKETLFSCYQTDKVIQLPTVRKKAIQLRFVGIGKIELSVGKKSEANAKLEELKNVHYISPDNSDRNTWDFDQIDQLLEKLIDFIF
jgi:hypothetical protein